MSIERDWGARACRSPLAPTGHDSLSAHVKARVVTALVEKRGKRKHRRSISGPLYHVGRCHGLRRGCSSGPDARRGTFAGKIAARALHRVYDPARAQQMEASAQGMHNLALRRCALHTRACADHDQAGPYSAVRIRSAMRAKKNLPHARRKESYVCIYSIGVGVWGVIIRTRKTWRKSCLRSRALQGCNAAALQLEKTRGQHTAGS